MNFSINQKWLRHENAMKNWKAILFSLVEQAPIILFLAARAYQFEQNDRILMGGGLALMVFYFWRFRGLRPTPLYFGTNTFFILASMTLLLPFKGPLAVATAMGEAGMFVVILACGAVWHFSHPQGLLKTREGLSAPTGKKYSWMLMAIYAICPLISYRFKGNENLAGALPFILIVVSENIFGFLQFRATRKLSKNDQ